jgi:DNA-binding LacI/PurR family transcriptional regulator
MKMKTLPESDNRTMLLTDRIHRNMFESILRGEFLPGQKFLTEQEAIDRYHASRITIRRAFALLEKDRIITRKTKTGSVVNNSFSASGGELHCIAAVVPLASHFVRTFLSTLCSEAAKRNIITVLEPAADGKAQNEALIRLVTHGLRDIVLWGADRDLDLDLCLRLRILGVNMTFFDQIAPGGIADYVCLDNQEAIRTLLDKAAECGIKNIFFSDPDQRDVDTNKERKEFCRKECGKRNWNFSSVLPDTLPPESAIFAVNDEAAEKMLDRGVPVFSIDGLENSRRSGIISYRQPMNELAVKCFHSLQQQRKLGSKWQARQYRLKNEEPFG